jgi:hypothetical protein
MRELTDIELDAVGGGVVAGYYPTWITKWITSIPVNNHNNNQLNNGGYGNVNFNFNPQNNNVNNLV